jgi:hypothetical protein
VAKKAGFLSPIEIFFVNRPINDPRGQTRAQCILPRPDKAIMMGVNIHTKPYKPKGCQKFAMVIQAMVMIHDQPCKLRIHGFDFVFVLALSLIFYNHLQSRPSTRTPAVFLPTVPGAWVSEW